ncbi:MAG: 2OG-Fe(II) oxygenase [Ferruginibacter sp.]|nr:2OG-Fe(II) oxygenase [Ferruginibacter sp.]
MLQTLFDIEPRLPEGFTYQPEFISKEEEEHLLQIISSLEMKQMQFHQYEAKRRVISFGQGWSFTEQQLKEGPPIPSDFLFLIKKIAAQRSIDCEEIAQMLITEYPPGAIINWHRDAPPFASIAGVSLKSDCSFKLRPQEKEQQTRKATISLNVQRRSLYIMQGKAKTDWQHSTAAAVDQPRYSITFRTLKSNK